MKKKLMIFCIAVGLSLALAAPSFAALTLNLDVDSYGSVDESAQVNASMGFNTELLDTIIDGAGIDGAGSELALENPGALLGTETIDLVSQGIQGASVITPSFYTNKTLGMELNSLSSDDALGLPAGKLMTLDQLKASMENGMETMAELDIDVDIDAESTIKETIRFSDIQLKENQSSLKTYTTSVEVPVSQSAWGEKINDKIVWLANQKIQYAEIHINPQELGPVEVKINVQNDQATVTFNSQHQGVRELLEMNVSRLRDMMSENGVDLAHVDVSDQSSQQQSQEESASGSLADGNDDQSLEGQGAITSSIELENLVDYYA